MSESQFSKNYSKVHSVGLAKHRGTQTVNNPCRILDQNKNPIKSAFNRRVANKWSSKQNAAREKLIQTLIVKPKYESTPVRTTRNHDNSESSDCEILIDDVTPIRKKSKSYQNLNDGSDSLNQSNHELGCNIVSGICSGEDRRQMLSLDETLLKSLDLEDCEANEMRSDKSHLQVNSVPKIIGNCSSKQSDNLKENVGLMKPPNAIVSVSGTEKNLPSVAKPKNKSKFSQSVQNNSSVSRDMQLDDFNNIAIDNWFNDSFMEEALNKTKSREKIKSIQDVSEYASTSKRPHDDTNPVWKKRLKDCYDTTCGRSKIFPRISETVTEGAEQIVEHHSNDQFDHRDICVQDMQLSKRTEDEREKLQQHDNSDEGKENSVGKVTSRNMSLSEKIHKMLLANASKQPVNKVHEPQKSISYPFAPQSFESFDELGPFFGLPSKVETLFKENKGIRQLYEWQKECLNLKAVKNKKNLVYALPTSGGKTLVAEVLLLREMLCHKKNALFILPYVAIVQEKVQSFYPFAIDLGFFVEEYAAGKGQYPPKIHRNKQTVYIATIEKAYSLINCLVEAKRLSEIGLVIVDELHLLGEGDRGATLECLLTRLLFSKESIHIVGMSATIGNLNEVAMFLEAEIYVSDFRPVELKEYVKCEDTLWAVNFQEEEMYTKVREVDPPYNDQMKKMDPDKVCSLVLEVVPEFSCLVFCPTKSSCENVAALFTKIMPKELLEERKGEKEALYLALLNEGRGTACPILRKTIPFGVAYHHSGLTGDERRLLEEAYRHGVLCCICCTSTLAAGVNLPARRVILRSPFVGGNFISRSQYKQMVGRAGRAGLDVAGESILVCQKRDMQQVTTLLSSPVESAITKLHVSESRGLDSLVLGSIGLGIATNRKDLHKMMAYTLLQVQSMALEVNTKKLVDKTISKLFKMGALEVDDTASSVDVSLKLNSSTMEKSDISLNVTLPISKRYKSAEHAGDSKKSCLNIRRGTGLKISRLGRAAMKGPIDLCRANELYKDLLQAQASMVLLSYLHMIYLVTPYDMMDQIKLDSETYFRVYSELNRKDLHTATVIGITQGCVLKIWKGSKSYSVPERVIHRFYITLILYDLWNQCDVWEVASKYSIPRGTVNTLMTSAASFASCVLHFCEELSEFWAFKELFTGFAQRLSHCCSADLIPLMELPAVKMGRARQLYRAGYKSILDIAKSKPSDLVSSVSHMSRKVANQIIAAAKMMLVNKAENLREEAEEAEDLLKGVLDKSPEDLTNKGHE